MRQRRGPIAALLVFVLASLFSTTFRAQQNGVKRPLTLAELTYGESINAMTPASGGDIWIGGYTCSATLPTTSGAIQRTWSGEPCVSAGLLARMKRDGTIGYLSYWGGSGLTQITSLATDASGYLYIGGWTQSSDFETTPGAFDSTCPETCSRPHGFVTKVSPDGSSVVYSTYLGGSERDQVSSIAVDSGGRAHVVGFTSSGDFPVTPTAEEPGYSGGIVNGTREDDAYYTRLSPDGKTLDHSTYLGGSSPDYAAGVAVDAAGNAYVVGTTWSTDFPTFHAANPQGPTGGNASSFLAKFSPSGPASGLVYSTYVGGGGASGATAVSAIGDRVYVAGDENTSTFPGGADAVDTASAAYVAEVAAASGAVLRSVAVHGVDATLAGASALVVDQNHVAYLAGHFSGNDCATCGRESQRFPGTWDAYRRELSGSDADAVLAIVDFGPQEPAVLYSSMVGGSQSDQAFGVLPDGSGGAFIAGQTESGGNFPAVSAQPQPSQDPGADRQSFVAHVGTEVVTMPTPPADIVLYTSSEDFNGLMPAAIAGDWKVDDIDPTAAGGRSVHEFDHGAAKVTAPSAYPKNYVELSFIADANVPYQLWLRMKADGNSYQNDSVWVQYSDSVDTGGNPVWRIHSTDGTFVSLEDCSGCGEQGWGWNDNGYGVPGTPVMFATSGWHTIRIQQREDGIAIDQIVLSSSKWLNTPPGANKNDATILSESYAVPSTTTNAPPTVAITNLKNGDTFTAPVTLTITASATDSDGTVSKVDLYANSTLLGTMTAAPNPSTYSFTWNDVPEGAYSVTAVATDNGGAATTSAAVSIAVTSGGSGGGGSLPEGWNDVDVGDAGAAGNALYSGGTFTVHGAGADVWGTSDAFNYAYIPLTGDGKIIARVATVSNEANWVKAGVMIRSSLSSSSAQAFMLVSHAKGVAFQRRTADGDTSVSTSGSVATAPQWVSLVRTAGTISAWESADGSDWTFVGSDTFTMPDTVLIGLAVSSHVEGTLATATFDGVMTQALPNGWADTDIGSVPFAGSANANAGTFTVTGSGADIWGTADAFHYVYHLLNGNATIIARVASIEDDVAPWVKAGLMIRNTFDPGSVHATVLVSASKGVAFQRRDVGGGTSVSTAGSMSTAPHWVKLTRAGDTFTAYESSDGTTWTEIGSDTIPMAQTIYVGLAVTSHSTSASATCTFDGVRIQ